MRTYTEKIREAAKRLLSEKSVDGVIGFRKGTLPFMNEPFLAKTPEQADQLVWDGNCGVNLSNYLIRRPGRFAVVAKGCDSRNISIQILENQVKRENLYILGIPCRGMIDRRKIMDSLNGREALLAVEDRDKITVSGKGFETEFNRSDVLQENCSICAHMNPVVFDEMLGEPVDEQSVDRYADIRDVEAMIPEEKRRFFEKLIEPCIRCYACRNACPMCYCPTCFVDESKPQWVGKSIDPSDTRTFHFLRAFHLAGRCTDCGACERACPMGIKLRLFTKKLEKEVKELYGYEAGMVQDQRPPLDSFRPDDPEPFMGQ